MRITEIKGVGEKSEKLLNKLGIESVEDLLTYYPRSYDIFDEPVFIKNINEPGIFAIYGEVSGNISIVAHGKHQIVSAVVKDYNGDGIKMVWYNMPFLKTTLKRGLRFVFRGRIVFKQGSYICEQPVMYTPADYEKKLRQMQPVYPLTAGITNNFLIKSMNQALELCDICHEYMPFEIRQEYRLMDYSEAVKKIHFPDNTDEYVRARKRIVFDEFFLFVLALRKMKDCNESLPNGYIIKNDKRTDIFISELPFKLTGAQEKVWDEIKSDMSGKKLMNRLIQGDVGCGKTIISILALMNTAYAGFQGAIMAPTEVLAKQHYETITGLFKKYDIQINVELLVGSMTAAQKKNAYERIKLGESSIIVGTNAIIQDKVEYKELALVITDEQHRFGVNQRKKFSEKGSQPGIIVMSATPIPRTLAIVIYGDLDISIIDILPSDRLPVKNCVVGEDYRDNAYRFIEKEVNAGHQTYIICPMVDESEKTEAENVTDYTVRMKERFPKLNVEGLHGKMKPDDKNRIMEAFAQGRTDILVSTTVVEVGVNVPNATVMLIENADRFGLAQLHQLRGRVGRGNAQSYCIMMSSSGKKETRERLEIMNKSNDGFYIASEDLKTRGPGDLFGIRQSGEFDFGLGDIFTDAQELKNASECVNKYLNGGYNISAGENNVISSKMEEYTRKCLNKLNI